MVQILILDTQTFLSKVFSSNKSHIVSTGNNDRLIDRYIRDGVLITDPLNKNQHACLSGKSTGTALHNLVGRINRGAE